MMLMNLMNQIRQSIDNKKGQGLVEYALIIGAIAGIVLIALSPLGTALSAKFTEIISGI